MCYNEMGIEPVNLNNEILALSSVQMPREMTTENGCHVSLCFRDEEDHCPDADCRLQEKEKQ